MRKVISFAVGVLLTLALASVVHSADIEFGVTGHSGAVNSVSYRAGINVSGEDAYATAQWNYGETAGIVSSDNGNLKLGYDPALSGNWSLWFFNQTGYNKIRGIEIESFLGLGPKYSFYKGEKGSISLSGGLIYHYEDGAMGSRSVKRLSIRPKARIEGKNTLTSFIAFWQPNIDDFDDYIVLAEFSVRYKVTDNVGLKVALNDEYRSVTLGEKNELTKMLTISIGL